MGINLWANVPTLNVAIRGQPDQDEACIILALGPRPSSMAMSGLLASSIDLQCILSPNLPPRHVGGRFRLWVEWL